MNRFNLGLAIAGLMGGVASAQTIYVPSGVSGVGVSSTSNVGIGTSAPDAMLDVTQAVAAGSSATAFIVQDSNPSRNIPLTYGYKAGNTGSAVALGFNWSFNFGGGGGQRTNTSRNGWALLLDDRDSITDGSLVIEHVSSTGVDTKYVVFSSTGNVGIGTTNPTQKLSVNGTIRAKEVIVDTGWSDYVFAPDYRLAPLSEVEQRIKTEGHLPGIPSAAQVAEHGVTVGEMQSKLLAKIEELTLHVIAQEKAISGLRAQNDALQREVCEMKAAGATR